MKQKNDFSVGSVKRLIISQAVPLTLAQAVLLLYNVVDRIYIGHLNEIGDIALTGLGITFPVIVIVAAFTSLFGTGGATLFSLARGKGHEDEAENIMGNVFMALLIASVLLFVLCLSCLEPVLFLFGASAESFIYANAYLKIYLFGTAFSMLATGMSGFINAQGFPRMGMLSTIIGALVNIVLDPIFIFGFNMGVEGAALATVISQAVSAFLVIGFLVSKRAILRLRFCRMKFSLPRMGHIVSLGLPGFVMQGTNSLVQITCNNQLQHYGGDLYVGIMTVLNSVREMVSLPVMGISHGAQPILGFNYGAKKNERVKEGIRFTATLGMVYTLVAWLLVMLIPKQLMGIFSEDLQTIEVGAQMLNIYFFGFVFMAFQFAGQTAFQALGKAKQAIFFSLFRKAIIVVPLTLLLPLCGLGVEGVFWAEPISNAIGGLAAFGVMWFTLYKKL
ncbi:MAG: MATE family efflux transporter [Clostridia bacterium]|nr:MATE family efflux transporter [Clostridia bacterium]